MSKIDNLEKEVKSILTAIQKYYEHYDVNSITGDELQTYFYYLNPSLPNKPTYDHLFSTLSNINITNKELIVDSLNRTAEKHIASKIITDAVKIIESDGSLSLIEDRIKEYQQIVGTIDGDDESEVCNLTLKELLDKSISGDLRWRLSFLNNTLGPIGSGGILGHIFARPESGKTSFACAELTYFGQQLRKHGGVCLYLGNEEGVERTKLRMYSAFLSKSHKYISDNWKKSENLWNTHIGKHVKVIGNALEISFIERMLFKHKPRVVFIDQGPKVAFPSKSKDSDTGRLQKLYNTYRQLAVKYETDIITLGQADTQSENRKWLGLNNLDQSKVGIPGELDFCIGIGKLVEPGYEELRYMNICKNKLTGVFDKAQVHFDYKTCHYK